LINVPYDYQRARLPLAASIAFSGLAALTGGCNSIMNGWLDPTAVGAFKRTATTEIRTSLTLEDTPPGIPGATYPTQNDLRIAPVDYPISEGDTLAVEIDELRERQVPYQAQIQVSSTGTINLPIVGRVHAAGMTVPEFEDHLGQVLRDRDVLVEPRVTVNPLFLQKGTFSIFGIGVSAADNAPLRAGSFPVRRPDVRVLEAINQVGGLNEFVADVYIFRNEPKTERSKSPAESKTENGENPQSSGSEPVSEEARERELMEAATGQKPQAGAPEVVVPDALAPEKPPPFMYVNDEFVPNPAFRKDSVDPNAAPIELPTFDTATPAVNWARIAGDAMYRVIRIPAESLRSGDPEMDIYIRAGDVIRIVSGEIGVYYVMGQVNRVGPFRFEAEPITLKAAIAAAGGLSGLAWPDRCTVYRRMGQREQMIQVNLDRIFAGTEPDFYIRRGDIVNVGTHPFAPFLQRIRAWTLPNPVNNVGYSFTYARNFADVDSFAARSNPANQPDRFPGLFP